jgi:SAM-dependent methyltransferase
MASEDHFGPGVAARYDADYAGMPVDTAVDVLAELAGDGSALELAIGTGRIALPLAARGVPVAGLDLSEAMVAQLRAKPGGEALPVTIGDMTTTRLDGRFRLVYLVFNTIGNLTTQEQQVACFANAAAHLEPGGHFVIEVGVPPLRRLPPGERHHVFHHADGDWGIDEFDAATQRMTGHYVIDGRASTIPFRYVWPSELDLMARLAGMELAERWEDWDASPFTHESERHVSVWRLAGL